MIRKLCLALFLLPVFYCNGSMTVSRSMDQQRNKPGNCSRVSKFTSEKDLKNITLVMKTYNVISVWLPLKRRRFDEWLWLDNTVYGESISPPGLAPEGADCALLRVGDKVIDDVPCNRKLNYFICETKGKKCLEIIGSRCLHFLGKTYIIYLKLKYTWYMSKQHCHENNMTLASFSKNDSSILMGKISMELGHYEKIWLGLRKAEYVFQDDDTETQEVNQFNWAFDSPCACPDSNCVILKDGKWEAENCSASHHYLCTWEQRHEKNTLQEGKHSPSAPIGAIVGATLGCAVIFFILLLIAFAWKRKGVIERVSCGLIKLKERDNDEKNTQEGQQLKGGEYKDESCYEPHDADKSTLKTKPCTQLEAKHEITPLVPASNQIKDHKGYQVGLSSKNKEKPKEIHQVNCLNSKEEEQTSNVSKKICVICLDEVKIQPIVHALHQTPEIPDVLSKTEVVGNHVKGFLSLEKSDFEDSHWVIVIIGSTEAKGQLPFLHEKVLKYKIDLFMIYMDTECTKELKADEAHHQFLDNLAEQHEFVNGLKEEKKFISVPYTEKTAKLNALQTRMIMNWINNKHTK